MPRKKFLMIFLIILFIFYANLFSAGKTVKNRELIFTGDFQNNPQIKGWYDVYKGSPKNRDMDRPKAEWYKVVTAGGKTFLKTEKVMFGISSLLKKPLTIDDSVEEIELSATLRVPDKKNNRPVTIALTSRDYPSGRDGGPFWRGHKDSGILAQGYQHSIQYANIIAWQKAGRQVMMSSPVPPFNLLTETGKWVTWRLVYRHQKKELCFYRDSEEKTPYVVQHNVDLTGIVVRSVWLGAWGTEYLNVEVFVRTTK